MEEVTVEEIHVIVEVVEEEEDSMKIAVAVETVTADAVDGSTARLKDFNNLGITRKSNA